MKRRVTIFLVLVISLGIAWADTGKLYTSDKLSSSLLTSVCQDKYGYIWIGSEYGLNKFDGYNFTSYHTSQGDTTSIINNNVSALYASSDGSLWVGLSKGLCRYDYHNNCFVRYTFPDNLRPRVNAIVEHNGDIFIGTAGYGLFTIRNGGTRIVREKKFRQSAKEDYCSRLFFDAKGRLWRSSHGSVVSRYVLDGNYVPRNTRHYDMPCGPVVNFIPLGDSGFLTVCMYGIMRYDYANERFIQSDIDMSLLREKVSIRTAFKDTHNNILIGTSGNGLMLVRKGSKKLETMKSPGDDGILTTSNVNDIIEDKTLHGNGLTTKEYRLGAVFHTPQDIIGFATTDGITVFRPSEVKQIGDTLGEVFLTGMTISGEATDCLASQWTIPYGESTFKMEFSLLDYSNTENITFEYRLNGGKWQVVPDGTNAIYFNRMMPGTYRLEVKATSSGAESSVKAFMLYVEDPWYASSLAYFIYFLLLLLAVALGFMYYRRRKHAELDEAKMQFLINATHDIRSPLTLIISPLERLKNIVNETEAKDCIDVIDRNAQRLLLLVNQILDERKIDKKQMHLHCSETDLVQFVRKHVVLYKFRAEQREISIRLSAEMPNLMVWIDRIHFDKVVSNLLSNAFKFTPDGGEILLSLRTDGPNAILEVIDSGEGIGEEKTEKLFERFYQGSNSRNLNTVGTGIGLNLSRAIVMLHGGIIKAANRTDNKSGACFTVVIPLGNGHFRPEQIVEADCDDVSLPKSGVRKRQPSKSGRIMIVDDDEEIAEYIRNEMSGSYRVTAMTDSRQALKAVMEQHYDLVISDVVMPGLDGISLLKTLKSNVNTSDIPVILLTSKADVEDRVEGLKRGADAYIAKPFNIEELVAQVDNLIDNVRRLRGKFSGVQAQEENVESVKVEGNDDLLMKRVMKVVNENYTDPDFNVEALSKMVGVSRAQLHRRIKEITGITTSEFLRNIRMEQAARLLKEGKINVTQVAYSVGYNNQTHFSTVFKAHFGMSPTEYGKS